MGLYYIIKDMEEELGDVEKYIERAVAFKAEGHTGLAETYIAKAQSEMSHAKDFHSAAENLCANAAHTCAEEIKEAWHTAAKKYVEKMTKLKLMIETAR